MSLQEARWFESCLSRGQHEIFFEMHTITPELAQIMLGQNTHNRKLRVSRTQSIAAAMAEGRWKPSHQGIAFSREGVLLDGQHRLEGVVEADAEVVMPVSFGWEPGTFEVIDTGEPRAVHDFLRTAGVENSYRRGAAARLIAIGERKLKSIAPDKQTILAVARRMEGPESEKACLVAHAIEKLIRPGPTVAALWLIQTQTKFPDRVEDFMKGLQTGANLAATDPILKLRRVAGDLPRAKGQGGGAASMRQLGAIILAWNAWVKGRRAPPLSWNSYTIPTVE